MARAYKRTRARTFGRPGVLAGRWLAGRWLAGLLLAMGGCERVGSAIEDKAQKIAQELSEPTAMGSAVGRTLTEHEQLDRKLVLYLECRASASTRIRQSWQRYDERIKADGTLRKRGIEPYLYKIDSELTPCEDAGRQGPLLRPPLPRIEQAMAEYLTHARTFAQLSVELDTYYETRGYAQDQWARGKQLAPPFAAAYAAWSEADDQLAQQVVARKDEVDRNRLVEVERRKGQDLEWHARHLVQRARALTRCVAAQRATAEGCQAVHTELETAQADFTRHADEHRSAAEAVFWMSSFRGSSERYAAQAQQILPALRKSHGVDEARDRLAHAFDALSADAKNLRFE